MHDTHTAISTKAAPIPSPYPVLRRHYWLVRDKPADERRATLMRHIESGDYFAVLATILGFLEETVRACHEQQTPMDITQVRVIESLREDLKFLHESYRIVPKEPK
jgi:hypothetical protein